MQLSSAAPDTRNGFTFFRIVAAIAVIFTHSFGAVGVEGDFLNSLGTYPASKFGVDAFFAMSGYLVTQSAMRNPSMSAYFLSRALRIFPALVVVVVLTIFVSAFFYRGADYFTSSGTWKYLLNITLYWLNPTIPGTFEGNHTTHINGSLWTLPLEFTCYVALALLFASRALRVWTLLLALPGLILFFFYGPLTWEARFLGMTTIFLVNLAIIFFVGSFLALLGSRMPVSPWLTLAAVAVIVLAYKFDGGFWQRNAIAHLLLLPYVVVSAALQLKRLAFLNRWDVSYGLYIYACVVQQVLEALTRGWGLGPYQFFALSVVFTVPFALASWVWIERPALRLKGRLTSASLRWTGNQRAVSAS